MLSLQTVQTTGINWESVSVIVGTLGTLLIGCLAFFLGLIQKHNTQIRHDISSSVDHLSEVLTAKLETKDAVNELRIEFVELKGKVEAQHSGN